MALATLVRGSVDINNYNIFIREEYPEVVPPWWPLGCVASDITLDIGEHPRSLNRLGSIRTVSGVGLDTVYLMLVVWFL